MNNINTTWIIDDDPIQVFLAKRILKNIEFSQNVFVFNNAKKALEELQNLRELNDGTFPDIILVDINMPQMDGWQFLKEFNKMPLERNVAIYLVTSSIDPDDVKKARTNESLSGYLIKPLKIKDLEEIRKKLNKGIVRKQRS